MVMSFGAANLINSGSPELLALVAAIDDLQKCARSSAERRRT